MKTEKKREKECFYKCNSGVPSSQDYHIYPASASNLSIFLQKGIVCDKCNEYYGRKIEPEFIHTHPGTHFRLGSLVRTKHSKSPVIFVENGRRATRTDNGETSTIHVPLDDIKINHHANGDISFNCISSVKPFDALLISRMLCKIGLETLFSETSQKVIDPYDPRFDSLKHYARFGESRALPFVWFAWHEHGQGERLPEIRLWSIGDHVIPFAHIHLLGLTYYVPLHGKPFSAELEDTVKETWHLVAEPGTIIPKPFNTPIRFKRKGS